MRSLQFLSRLRFAFGAFACWLVAATSLSAQTTPTAWLQKARHADIVYFTFANRIERYDLATEAWLAPIALASSPKALFVDAGGIYYSVGRTAYKRALDGTGETPIYNARADIMGLLADGSFVFIFSGGSTTYIESLRKSDWQFVAMTSATYAFSAGFSILPSQRRLYGVDSMTSSNDTDELAYNADGTFGSIKSVYGSTDYSQKGQTVVSPQGTLLLCSNGRVCSIPDLTHRAILGEAFTAGDFWQDAIIVLRSNKLYLYDNAFFESGLYTLSAAAGGVDVRSGQVYAFRASSTAASGIEVEKVAVSTISAYQPGTPVDPELLTFVPDEVVQAAGGDLLLVSKKERAIYRWSPSTARFTASYPLKGTPSLVSYSSTLNRIYSGYSGGTIYTISLGTSGAAEVPFANTGGTLEVLCAMDDLVLAGSTYSSKVYNSGGAVLGNGISNSGYPLLWSSAQRRLYVLDSTPAYYPVSSTGVFGTAVRGTYNSSVWPQKPARLSADMSILLGANGQMFRTSDLTYVSSLSNSFTDSVPRSGNWATIRLAGIATQLQLWSSTYFFDRGFTIAGYPLRVFSLSDGRLVVLTTSGGSDTYGSWSNTGSLIFSIIDPAGQGSVTSGPYISSAPANATWYTGKPATLSASAVGQSLTYQWRKNGADIPGATSATLEIPVVKESDAGSYSVFVRNSMGSALTVASTVTVTAPPPAPSITTQPRDAYVSLGSYASLYVYASGSGLTYQWRKDGVAIASATTYSISVTAATDADFGAYDVVVSNPGGSTTSSVAMLQKYVTPTITSTPADCAITEGATATFTGAASGAPAPTLRWQGRAGAQYTFADLSNNAYFSGVSTPTLTIFNSTRSMSGYQFRLAATSQSNGYPTVYSAPATLYVTGAPKITSASRTTFVAGISNSFIVTAAGTPKPTFSAVDLPSWASLDSATGVLSGTPPSTAGSPFAVTLKASNGTLPNDEQAFILSVQATAGAPKIISDPAGKSVGVGAAVTFSVGVAGTEPMTYQWTKNGTTIAGATSASYSIPSVTTADAGRYAVTVTNAEGAATSRAAALSVVPEGVGATHRVLGAGYLPGGVIVVSTTINFTGAAKALGCQVLLPQGWAFVSGSTAQGQQNPAAGTTDVLEWVWTNEPTGPVTFTYTVSVPESESADRQLAVLITLRTGTEPILLLGLPDPLPLKRLTLHSADTDGNNRISLYELTRVVELYNTRNGGARTGCYTYDPAGEDGFAPDANRGGTTSVTLPTYHSADSNHDGKISVFELTRVIELFNFRRGTQRTGEYYLSPGTEDGFALGVDPSGSNQ